MYSAADIERIALLRQLTNQGHAIGLLAKLNTQQLTDMLQAARSSSAPKKSRALRIVVVSTSLALRLQRPELKNCWLAQPQTVAVFESLAQAKQAATLFVESEREHARHAGIDVLLVETPDLQNETAAEVKATHLAWRARSAAVVYRFSSASSRQALTTAGAHMMRESADDAALAAWLCALELGLRQPDNVPLDAPNTNAADRANANAWSEQAMRLLTDTLPQPKFSDTTLTEFAGLSSIVACECPGHVAELLAQISSFETYSASCANRSSADAELHSHLQRVAGAARLLFEEALERVAVAEGFVLPAASAP